MHPDVWSLFEPLGKVQFSWFEESFAESRLSFWNKSVKIRIKSVNSWNTTGRLLHFYTNIVHFGSFIVQSIKKEKPVT